LINPPYHVKTNRFNKNFPAVFWADIYINGKIFFQPGCSQISIAGMIMLKQGERLNEIFEDWRGDSPQIDDVTMIGVRY